LLAVVGGLGAACCWAMTGILAKNASKSMDGLPVFAWTALSGTVLTVVPAVIALTTSHVSSQALIELAVAGVLNVLGLVCEFCALVRGSVTLVIPLTSAEGAIAAAVAAVAGVAQLGAISWIALGAVVVGLVVTASARTAESSEGKHNGVREVVLALMAAALFGTGLFFQGHAAAHVPVGLAIAPPSVMGALLVGLPMAASGSLPPPAKPGLLLPAIAAAELIGFIAYVVGSRDSIPVTAVLSSQFATISVIASIVLYRERPGRIQVLGYLLIAAGVAIISIHG
jgi:drug/metabolite transporter (DMT)-like permease